jgi:hypothetical protein
MLFYQSMAVVLHYDVTYSIFADLRPEPAIITTRYASFTGTGIGQCHQQQSQHHHLGNDSISLFFLTCDLPDI